MTDFGAVADGNTDNAVAIQNAIAAAGAARGGTVEIPAGVYASGPIVLTNNLCLQIDSGATLKLLPPGAFPGTMNFITGTNLHDVEISGAGTIDGNGASWWGTSGALPTLVRFSGCSRILVQNVQLKKPPSEHLAFVYGCGDSTVRGVQINTTSAPGNTAGIHLSGTNCLVHDCNISNDSDDNIQIQTSEGRAADIVVTNCTFGSGHGLSIGSNTSAGVSNVVVTGCTFNGIANGIRLKSDRDRGGVVENISYRNNTMTGVQIPIILYSYYKSVGSPNNVTPVSAAADAAKPVTSTTPIWHNITVSNLTATTQSGYVAGIIWGLPEMVVSNVMLEKINISASKSFDIYNAHGIHFTDVQLNLPGGVPSYTLWNADVTVSNSPSAVSFDGLTTAQTGNALSLINSMASVADTNAIGTHPVLALENSVFTVNNNLDLADEAVMDFALGANPSQISVSGNLTLAGKLNFSEAPGFDTNSYTLFTYSGTLVTNNVSIGERPSGYAGFISTSTPGQVRLVVERARPDFSFVEQDGMDFVLHAAHGAPNTPFYVLGSTNLALPLNEWMHIETNYFDADGTRLFRNTLGSGAGFFRLQLP